MSEPAIDIAASLHGGTQAGPLVRVVWHDEEYPVGVTSAEDVGRFFAGLRPPHYGSAHYICDPDSEVHAVPDGVVAYHAPPNGDGGYRTLGIEQDGYARFGAADWDTPGSRATRARTAARTAEIATRPENLLPVVWLSVGDLTAGRRGITSHNNVSQAFHQSDHIDPGAHFPVDETMRLVVWAVHQIGVATVPGVWRQDGTAIRAFQAAHGLVVDGDPGRKTVLALGSVMIEHFDAIVAGRPIAQEDDVTPEQAAQLARIPALEAQLANVALEVHSTLPFIRAIADGVRAAKQGVVDVAGLVKAIPPPGQVQLDPAVLSQAVAAGLVAQQPAIAAAILADVHLVQQPGGIA